MLFSVSFYIILLHHIISHHITRHLISSPPVRLHTIAPHHQNHHQQQHQHHLVSPSASCRTGGRHDRPADGLTGQTHVQGSKEDHRCATANRHPLLPALFSSWNKWLISSTYIESPILCIDIDCTRYIFISIQFFCSHYIPSQHQLTLSRTLTNIHRTRRLPLEITNDCYFYQSVTL